MNIKSLLKNNIFKNASWMILGKIIQMIISFFVGIFTARFLGPSNYGIINYASAYIAFFTCFCKLGINSILIKKLIDNPKKEGEILGSSVFMMFLSTLASIVIILCVVSIADANDPTVFAVTFLCAIGLIFNIFDIFNLWFQSKLKSKVTAIISLIAYSCTAIYKIILLILQKDVTWFAFSMSLDYMIVAFLLLYSYKKYGGQKLTFSFSQSKSLLSMSYHFILPSLMVAIYGYTDKFMLKQMLGSADVGYYSTATNICSMWTFVLSAIIDSMIPGIMEAHNKDKEEYIRKNKMLYCIVFYICMFVSVFFTVFADFIISILYGAQYSPAVMPFRIITWYTAFSYLGVARNSWFVCENKQKYLKYIYFSSALSNIVLNLILIPVWGASGAALASLLTQIITIIVVPFFIKGTRQNSIMIIQAIFFR